MNTLLNKKCWLAGVVSFGLLLLICQDANAAGAVTIDTMATTIKKSIETLIEVIKYGAYIAGVGFLVGGILKFKQHKDNPTQVTVGQPIALILIAGALLFMPTLIEVAKTGMFGEQAESVMDKK